ncbi:hypothetical protein Ait01nite_084310 [Actinoplanes italicus]|nr:hypothetical protein Ait01nite_084310 [Actinoplanes italicus]
MVLVGVAAVSPVAAFAGLPNAGAASVPADTASAADSTAADHLLSEAGRRGVSVLIHSPSISGLDVGRPAPELSLSAGISRTDAGR